jgi:hypothetical protein
MVAKTRGQMGARERQEARRSERAHVWSPEDTYLHVFAAVVAWHDAHGEPHAADDERKWTAEITEAVHPEVRTGLTANQRQMMIRGAVAYALG